MSARLSSPISDRRQRFKRAGFANVSIGLTQLVALERDVKLFNVITVENIADAVVQASLATRNETGALIREPYDSAANPETPAGTP